MNKAKIIKRIKNSIQEPAMCRCYFHYDNNYYYYFPLKLSTKLFLGVEEDDFLLDGYSIRRLKDLDKIEIRDDKCLEMAKAEGLIEQLSAPDIDIESWKTVFLSLQKKDKNIIIRHEDIDESEYKFAIGRIENILDKKVVFHTFDADGIWQEDLLEIPFESITSVTAESRYINVFSKYLPPYDLVKESSH